MVLRNILQAPVRSVLNTVIPTFGEGESDPDFASVTALYGFNQANFDSGVNNDGSLGVGSVFNSGVAPDTGTVLDGLASGEFNQNGLGSNDGILIGTTDAAIGVNSSVDFTLECWLFVPNAQSDLSTIFSHGTASATLRLIMSLYEPGDATKPGQFELVLGASTIINSADDSYPVDTWFHFALASTSGSMEIYADGARVINTSQNLNRTGDMLTGRHNVLSQPLSGPAFMDEMRITKGVKRYTGATLTVPSFPLPRS